MASANHQTLNTLSAKVKTLVNNDLRAILRNESLPTSGVKSALQSRIIGYLHRLGSANDAEGLNRIAHQIYHNGEKPPPPSASVPANTYAAWPSLPPATNNTMPGGYGRHANPKPTAYLKFKSNPFYDVLDPVSNVLNMPMVQTQRSQLSLTVKLSDDICQRLRADSSLRVYLFGAGDPVVGAAVQNEIAFPQQLEVRINQNDFKANFKGLKNKPGSTRPADITGFLRKQPAGFNNNISITYALTNKRFNMVAMLVRKRSIDELIRQIKTHGVISKERVLRDIREKANDPDIVATSHVMSLKDPLSMSRIQLACRTVVCTHLQCFDAECFLQLQEQAPTWTCPICSKVTDFEGVVVDQYFQGILDRTSKSAEQVTIEPNGEWYIDGQTSDLKKDARVDSEDDLVEIIDPRTKSIKQEAPITPFSLNTPSNASREQSVSTPATLGLNGAVTQKRKAEVIDLTLSEDDEPPRPTKRQETSHNRQSGVFDRQNGYPVQNAPFLRPPSTVAAPSQTLQASNAPLASPQSNFQQEVVGNQLPSFSPTAVAASGKLNSAPPVIFTPPQRLHSFGAPGPFPLATNSENYPSSSGKNRSFANGTFNLTPNQHNTPNGYS